MVENKLRKRIQIKERIHYFGASKQQKSNTYLLRFKAPIFVFINMPQPIPINMKRKAKFLQKTIALAVLTLLFCSNAMLGQSIRLGRVTPDDFIKGVYEKDPDASAVIFYDYGENVFDLNTKDGVFYYDHKRTMRMQIHDERAFDYADYSIRL